MKDTKLKATNEQTRKTNKQKLIPIDNSTVVTRGKGGGVIMSKGSNTGSWEKT